MASLDFWLVLQTFALVTAGFGIWILGRACWEYAGVPAVQDAYLELADARLRELEPAAAPVPAGSRGAGAWAAGPFRVPAAPADRSAAAGFARRVRNALGSRPSEQERAASQAALLQLLARPHLAVDQQQLAARVLAPLAGPVSTAGSVRELAATARLSRQAVLGMLRREVPARFRSVFLPGMARYLDFIGRGSSLGLAVGVLLAGGMNGNADLVGVLTTVCGVGGAIIFTLTVLRCEARSWPAGRAGLWLRLARRFPQLFFLLRLLLTTAALLLGLYILGR